MSSWRQKRFRHFFLAVTALETLRRESEASPELETGGALVGYELSDGSVVCLFASGLGPRSHRSSSYVFLHGKDTEAFVQQSKDKLPMYHVGYIGDWHTHPVGGTTPSKGDRRALETIILSRYCPFRTPVTLIYCRHAREELAVYALKRSRLVRLDWSVITWQEMVPEGTSQRTRPRTCEL